MTRSRFDCQALDLADPLGFTRARFSVPPSMIYLDGNSLGALPIATPGRLQDLIGREWGQNLIGSWNSAGWMDLPSRIGARIAPLIGAHADEVVAGDSTSVVLFKLAAAAVRLRPDRRVIVSETGNFPTDLYVLQGLAETLGLELRVSDPQDVAGLLNEDVALLVLTHVHYKSGRIHDMKSLTSKAHQVGALTLWDLSHSAGALEVNFQAAQADFAVGCGYKYFNGGPGAPGFMVVARRHQKEVRQPLFGWIGHAEPFAFADLYQPAEGIKRVLTGTPAVIGLVALEEGLKTFDGVDMSLVRQKSVALGELFLELLEAWAPGAFELACSPDPRSRGSQISLRHPNAYAIVQALIAAGVVGDFRAPDVARFGLTPLYLSYEDIFEGVERLSKLMREGGWREARFSQRLAVT